MAEAQHAVDSVVATDPVLVGGAITAVEKAILACRAAGRAGEVEQLSLARTRLTEHQARLEKQTMKKKQAPTAEELKLLAKEGDPDCPKGQGYRHSVSHQEIRCTGPGLLELRRDQLARHFSKRSYSVRSLASPERLVAEQGAERFDFEFQSAEPQELPSCLVLFPKPGVSWQEAVARATGARVDQLKPNRPVTLEHRTVPMELVGRPEVTSVKLGKCRVRP